jgi:hypothetical protein
MINPITMKSLSFRRNAAMRRGWQGAFWPVVCIGCMPS